MRIGNVDIMQGIDVLLGFFEQLSADDQRGCFRKMLPMLPGHAYRDVGIIVVNDEPAICRRRLSQTVLLSARRLGHTPLVGDFPAKLIHKHFDKKTIGELFQRDIYSSSFDNSSKIKSTFSTAHWMASFYEDAR